MRSLLLIFSISFLMHQLVAQNVYSVNNGSVKFSSDAPLELIEAENNSMQGALKISDRSFLFRSPMKSFDGFNSSLQKTHFNTNYLETSKFPYTQYEGKIIEDVDFSTPGTYMVRGKGRFVCHGVEQERIIKCKLIVGANSIKITSEFTVLLDDHDIKIPSVMNNKIAEEITVNLDLELSPKE